MSAMEKLDVRAVIFDLGSTLIDYPSTDWDEVSLRCVENGRKCLLAKGVNLPDESDFSAQYIVIRDEYRKQASETLIEWNVPQVVGKLFQRIKITLGEDLIEKFFDAYYEPIEQLVNAYDDAIDVLERIKSRYGTIGLVSNTIFPPRAHLQELERFNLRPFFDFTIFSSAFGVRKPHPDIFYEASTRAGAAPGECVYIGDRYREDVEGPNGIGMHSILRFQPDRAYPEDKLSSLRIINSLSELVDHIDI